MEDISIEDTGHLSPCVGESMGEFMLDEDDDPEDGGGEQERES
jgi:hypothetical protein